jgi:hypothetical protein
MNFAYWKTIINNTKACPDGNTINCCADCLATLIHELVEDYLYGAGD